MRGLEERLRLALEGTETGFWEWYVDRRRRVVRQHGPALRPPARHAARRRRRLPRPHRPPATTARRSRASVRDALEHGTRLRARPARDLAPARHGACAGCTPAPAPPTATGRVERITGLLSDVTERRQREEAREFLDTASQVLAASMDPVQTLEEVAQLAVPRLADWCAVQLAADDRTGVYEQVAVAHVDPAKVRWARELQDRYPPDPDSPTGAPAVIRTGRSELYPRDRQRAAGGRRARRGADPARPRAADALGDGRPAAPRAGDLETLTSLRRDHGHQAGDERSSALRRRARARPRAAPTARTASAATSSREHRSPTLARWCALEFAQRLRAALPGFAR